MRPGWVAGNGIRDIMLVYQSKAFILFLPQNMEIEVREKH
jgi:hypothetical protein